MQRPGTVMEKAGQATCLKTFADADSMSNTAAWHAASCKAWCQVRYRCEGITHLSLEGSPLHPFCCTINVSAALHTCCHLPAVPK